MTPPETGKAETLEDGLRRILAPNPGPMTHWGTNSFILGEGRVAVIDPGPDSSAHLDAILAATSGEDITHILVTHAHLDHSPLARRLARATGAPILAFGPPDAGRSDVMSQLSNAGLTGGGEGVDRDFSPDVTVKDGDRIDGATWSVTAVHTPGHFAGHLGFQFGKSLISGDHVMDWSSSLVSPPDGDLTDFMNTSHRLRDADLLRLYPAHGGPIEDPADRLGWLIEHRLTREASILGALESRPLPLAELTARVYSDIHPSMLPAAERNVLAHLIDLHGRAMVHASPALGISAKFSRP